MTPKIDPKEMLSTGYTFGTVPVRRARGGRRGKSEHMLALIGDLTRLDKRPWLHNPDPSDVDVEATDWMEIFYPTIQGADAMQRRVAMYARDEKLKETRGWTYETSTGERKPEPKGFGLWVRKRKTSEKANAG